MRLAAFEIENYRGIEHVRLEDLSNFNVLIGKNNAGKTSIMTAISLFFKIPQHGYLVRIDPPIAGPLDFHENAREICLAAYFEITTLEKNEISNFGKMGALKEILPDILSVPCLLRIEIGIVKSPILAGYFKCVSFVDSDDWGNENTLFRLERDAAEELIIGKNTTSKLVNNNYLSIGGDGKEIPSFVSTISGWIGGTKVHYLTEGRQTLGEIETSQLLKMKVGSKKKSEYKLFQETINILLGHEIDAYDDDGVREVRLGEIALTANGSGVQQAIRIILDIQFESPKIILVEEPETHLHPALEFALMRYLRQASDKCQIFITTHSTNFIDTSGLHDAYIVSNNSGPEVSRMSVKEAQEHIIRELGMNLSSFFMYDRLVFVEGNIDIAVLKVFAEKINLSLGMANVGFINMTGGRHMHCFAVEQTLNFLKCRNVSLWFIVDNDEKDASEFEKIKESLGGKAKLHSLRKREIENYLTNPDAIAKFIQFKQIEQKHSPNTPLLSTDVIEKSLEECANKLKQFLVLKKLERTERLPIYSPFEAQTEILSDDKIAENAASKIDQMIESLNVAKTKLAQVITSTIHGVNMNWEQSKLDIVPGDELLQCVCEKFGVKFKKKKDSARLASFFAPDDVPSEIGIILREIASADGK